MRLFYCTDKSDTSFLIKGDDHRHILKVMRFKVGDAIDIIDGSGWIFKCEISTLTKYELTAQIITQKRASRLPYNLAIAISPLKNMSRFEWFLEKSVEIGITDIYPLICNRTEKGNIKIDRARRIIQSAMKQSGFAFEPLLHEKLDIKGLSQLEGWESKYIAYIEDEMNNLLGKEKNIKNNVLIAIGPEGGFMPGEVNMCVSEGFVPVSLGKNRLRTETAGVIACQIIKTLQEIGHVNTIETT